MDQCGISYGIPPSPRPIDRDAPTANERSVGTVSVSRVLARSTGTGPPLPLRPRWREVTARRARAARSGTDALRVAIPEQETTMNLDLMLAQLRGTPPSDVLQLDSVPQDWPTCVQKRCRNPVDVKKNGEYARSCRGCLQRRARSCKRRRAALVARGGCRRCAYRKRLKGDFLCARCRKERDIERAQKRQDAIDAAAIDEFAAQPEHVHKASNLDCGVSPLMPRR